MIPVVMNQGTVVAGQCQLALFADFLWRGCGNHFASLHALLTFGDWAPLTRVLMNSKTVTAPIDSILE